MEKEEPKFVTANKDTTGYFVTFGGSGEIPIKKGDRFFYGFVKFQCDSFIIFQNGLNFYTFSKQDFENV